MSSVMFKGNKNGIVIHILSNDLELIKSEIYEKLQKGKDFFHGSNMFVRSENELPEDFLKDLRSDLKSSFNANLIVENKKIVNSKKNNEMNEGNSKIIKRTIRSGQRISYDGNIIIIGDINSGAEVIATGNIVVLGVVRGIVHAGSEGNLKAFIAAYDLRPELVKIADIISRFPDNAERAKIPEIAKLKGKYISIEPYLPNKIQ